MRGRRKKMQDKETMTTPEAVGPPKRKKGKLAAVIAIIVALLVLVFGGLFLYSKQNNDLANLENEVKAKLGQLENKSNDEIRATLDEFIEEGTIRVSINMNPVFPTGDSNGTLQLENHPNNHYNLRCVITADVNGDAEEEELYHSGLMPVNSHIQEDVLNTNLDKGEYPATATFTAYDVDTDEEIGIVVAQIRISVLN